MTSHVYGFFMPGCGYCDDFIPAFETVMTSFEADDDTVMWHKVNGTTPKGSDLMDSFGLKHMFPTVIVVDSDGNVEHYHRTSDKASDFNKFVMKNIT